MRAAFVLEPYLATTDPAEVERSDNRATVAGRCGPFAACSGVSGRLVGPAAFKAVEASFARRLVGSIPIHSRLKTTCFADSMPL